MEALRSALLAVATTSEKKGANMKQQLTRFWPTNQQEASGDWELITKVRTNTLY